MTPQLARLMAAYNRWMNERLYAVCGELSDAERRQDRGAFFRSIHGTLNHLLLADNLWLSRFGERPFEVRSLDQELCADFGALRSEREATDRRIDAWVSGLNDATLAAELQYTSLARPGVKRVPTWIAVTHFFNHHAHHRGQLTTLLSQCGKDYGVTDVIGVPELASFSQSPKPA
jgi:uncharacterized damage-inducible protein DinB